MTVAGCLQIAVFLLLIAALAKPLGVYLHRVFEGVRQPLPKLLGPIERFLCRLCGVDPSKEQTWLQYTLALLVFSLLGLVVTYAIERLQGALPLNPQRFAAVPPDLAFNTAASFHQHQLAGVLGRVDHELPDPDG